MRKPLAISRLDGLAYMYIYLSTASKDAVIVLVGPDDMKSCEDGGKSRVYAVRTRGRPIYASLQLARESFSSLPHVSMDLIITSKQETAVSRIVLSRTNLM